jgi:nucleoid-associated protein YgaU
VIVWVRSLIGKIASKFSDDLPVTSIVINPIPPGSKTGDGSKEIVVMAGDTLSGLANKHYGSMEYWPLLWDATVGPNPNRIFPVRRLSVPDLSRFTAAQLMDARRRFPKWRSYR